MKTRIRYTNVDGVLISKPMLAVSDIVIVTLDPSERTVSINTSEGKNVFSGSANSLVKLKKIAKQELKTYGVQFNDEVRRRSSCNDCSNCQGDC